MRNTHRNGAPVSRPMSAAGMLTHQMPMKSYSAALTPSAPARRMPQIWTYWKNRRGRVTPMTTMSCSASRVTSAS